MATNTQTNTGISFLGALGLMLIAAKIFGIAPVADWSWWAVTAPLWGVAALILAIVIIGAILIILFNLTKITWLHFKQKRKK